MDSNDVGTGVWDFRSGLDLYPGGAGQCAGTGKSGNYRWRRIVTALAGAMIVE